MGRRRTRDPIPSRPLCPLCAAATKRLGPHLKKKHKLAVDSNVYLDLLAHAGVTRRAARCRPVMDQPAGASVAERTRICCPLCSHSFFRLDQHLQKKHKLQRDSALYKTAMLRPSPVDSSVTSLSQLLSKFRVYLTSLVGKGRTLKAADESTKRVERILTDLSLGDPGRVLPGCHVMSAVSRLRSIGEKDGLLEKYARDDGLTASTLLCYVYSAIDLLKYLVIYPEAMPSLVGGSVFASRQEQLTSYLLAMKNCARSLAKQRQIETRRRRVAESVSSIVVEPDVLGWYTRSDLVAEAVDLLTQLDATSDELSIDEFTLIRDRLAFYVIATNFCRTGEILNVTVDEWKNAQRHGDSGDRICIVAEHKQAALYYSRINFSYPLYDYLSLYVELFQSLVFVQCPYLFPFADRSFQTVRQLTHVEMNVSVKRVWNDLRRAHPEGAQLPSSVSVSAMRKWAVSWTHESAGRTEQEELANHMTHTWQMASSHYDLRLGLELTSRVTRRLRHWLREGRPRRGKASSYL